MNLLISVSGQGPLITIISDQWRLNRSTPGTTKLRGLTKIINPPEFFAHSIDVTTYKSDKID